MAGAGAAAGLVLGGLLTTYASWRWVFFVNVPIGILIAAAAPCVLTESPRLSGRIDWAGAVTGYALAVGFSRAFVVAAGIALLALLIGIATIRVRRQELAGAAPEPQQAAPQPAAPQSTAPQPGTVQRPEDRAALAAAARPCRFC
jgi:MFS family permease